MHGGNIQNKMKSICAITCVVWAVMTGCVSAHETKRITNGVYREATSIESVTVRGETVEFKIRVVKLDRERVFSRLYRYELTENGKIRVLASSNDPVFVGGVLQYDWFWDGRDIIRKEPKSGNSVIFDLQTEVQK